MNETKICSQCRQEKSTDNFYQRKRKCGFVYMHTCKNCCSERWSHTYEKQRIERKNPNFRPKYILKDALATDKKIGFEGNNLTIKFITECIKNGCSYCGNNTLSMSLDRIDNDLPHTQNNVKPACIRCNFLRKTMPYEAWLQLLPGLRSAEEKGLFGNWTGTFERSGRRKKYIKKSQ